MCGQGVEICGSDLLLLTARLRGVLSLRMACGASLVGAVSVVALTLAGRLRGVLCRLSVALRARFFAVLRVLAFCFAAGLC